MGLEKAYLDVEGKSGHVPVMFNPSEYNLSRGVNYAEKLTEIIAQNDIKSVTVVRMEVPCCGGMEQAVKTALQNSGKFIPWQVVTISIDGRVLE